MIKGYLFLELATVVKRSQFDRAIAISVSNRAQGFLAQQNFEFRRKNIHNNQSFVVIAVAMPPVSYSPSISTAPHTLLTWSNLGFAEKGLEQLPSKGYREI